MIIKYLVARIRSFGYAFRGLGLMILTQPHPQLHALATITVVIAGALLHLRRWEWVAILLCIGMVWVAEAMNSALEFLADEVSLEKRERIRNAKDVAAGGVLIAAIVSVVVAAMVFWNHLR